MPYSSSPIIAAFDRGSVLRQQRAAALALEHEENTGTCNSIPLTPGNNILQTQIHPQSSNNPTSSDNNSTSLQHSTRQVQTTQNVRTIAVGAEIVEWMCNYADKNGSKCIASKTLRHFPQYFRGRAIQITNGQAVYGKAESPSLILLVK